jgi:hypothetical protein
VYTACYWENLREKDHVEDPDVVGVIVLKWILKKWVGGYGFVRSS